MVAPGRTAPPRPATATSRRATPEKRRYRRRPDLEVAWRVARIVSISKRGNVSRKGGK